MKRSPVDPELLRSRLAEAQGKTYWRCLEELAGEPAFQEMMQREFPEQSGVWAEGVSRRRFLTLMGASLALGGLVGCRPPGGKIMPYSRTVPENLVPGKPLYYATSMEIGGLATGLLVESHEGRPTKIEGNPAHPASLGATGALHQAAILGMYDPDRSRSVAYRGQPRSWPALLDVMRDRLRWRAPVKARVPRVGGEGVAVLAEPTNSPTFHWQKERFESAYPQARWFSYTAVNDDNALAGAELAFGSPVHSYHKLDKADVIVSLDSDFLNQGPAHLAYARQFASRRRAAGGERGMSRLYAVETELSVTGSRADHRLAVKPSQVEAFVRGLASELKVAGAQPVTAEGEMGRWAKAVAADLARVKSAGVVLVGPGQPARVHAIAHAINQHLGNAGTVVFFTQPLPSSRSRSMSNLEQLCGALHRDEIDTLLILGGNPVYAAPADLPLGTHLKEQLNPEDPRRREAARENPERWLAVHLGLYFDETARWCHWHVPEAHFLEAWGDGVAFDGTASITQPLISPLYGGKSALELLAALTPTALESGNYEDREPAELLRAYWKSARPDASAGKPFETFWQEALHEGVIPGSAAATIAPTLDAGLLQAPELRAPAPPPAGYELQLAVDAAVHDGRFANNGWMQEWPRPLTRLTWDNAVLMSPKTADELKVKMRVSEWTGGEHGRTNTDRVAVEVGGKRVTAPVFIVPGHADGAITLHLGYGRTNAGRVGSKVGVDAYRLMASAAPYLRTGVKVAKAAGGHALACVQAHHLMEGRDPVRSGTVAEYKKDREFIHKHGHGHGAVKVDEEGRRVPVMEPVKGRSTPLSLFPEAHAYDGYKWGMAVDLSACTGCGACVVACQSENNSPVVGKDQVLRGREMHWMRIDYYIETPADAPHDYGRAKHHFQPVMCQHCENAPCELVCPVAATAHGDEGTNDMVYNRCVGTRYCANNCPYKVRRFNFLQYSDYETPSLRLMYNPDVTVRSRGVMEKCTFCIQRVAYARIEAAKEALDAPGSRVDPNGRKVQGQDVAYIRDGEVVSACQAACPSEAIVFGDLNDKDSRARKMHQQALRYDLLGELGTRPRVAYLAELRNPNPALEAK